jgi:hypothetical protein
MMWEGNYIVKAKRNFLLTRVRRKVNWIGYRWHRNCFLKHACERKREERLEVNRRQGRRSKQMLYDVEEKRGYWKSGSGPGSSVSIATGYGMDDPRIFRTRPDRPWGQASLLYNGYRVFPGIKRPGFGADHPPLSSAEVTKG